LGKNLGKKLSIFIFQCRIISDFFFHFLNLIFWEKLKEKNYQFLFFSFELLVIFFFIFENRNSQPPRVNQEYKIRMFVVQTIGILILG
jgi:hypothetical protein